MLFQIFFGLTLSFSLFPGVLQARPVTFIKTDDWYTLFMVGLFNIFNVLGRALGGYPPLMISKERPFWLNFFAFSRVSIVAIAVVVELGVFADRPQL